MKKFFFKLFLLITFLIMSNADLLAQYTLTKYEGNPVLSGSGSSAWDKHVGAGRVIFNPDSNRYEMFYIGYNSTRPYKIGFATSPDGINWTKYAGNPVLVPDPGTWDAGSVEYEAVIYENGVYKMWYSGIPDPNSLESKIGYATSPDGINWTKYSGNPVFTPGSGWDAGGVYGPSVIPVDTGGYIMWYQAKHASLPGVHIGRATSVDGINWVRDTINNPVFSPGVTGEWDGSAVALPNVVRRGEKYFMWYTGSTTTTAGNWKGGLAFSSDEGKTWTKFSANPVLQKGVSGSWDSNETCPSGAMLIGDSLFYVWYEGSGYVGGTYYWQLGLATSPLQLNVLLQGTYTVGTGGDFETIQEAFNKLEIDGIAGNVTLELIDELYIAPTDSFGFKLNGPIAGAGPNSRVTIKPAENKNVVIQGNGAAVFWLINTSYVTFDGVSVTGPTTLTIHSLQNSSYAYNDGLDFIKNSDHNIIRNIIFITEDITRPSGSGFWCPDYSIEVGDNNLIENNFFKKAGIAFYMSAGGWGGKAKDNIIRGNIIGSEADSLITWGIQLENCQNTIVENNIIQNITHQAGFGVLAHGINSYSGSGCIIRNNIVHNIKARTLAGATGILLSGGQGSGDQIYNNMIYNIQSSSTQFDSRVTGIQLWNQTNPKIYYNTIYLSGTGMNKYGSASLYIAGSVTNADVKNNIFVNTRDESPYCASAIYDYTSGNLTSDYNDLYYDNANAANCMVRIGSTKYNTLADWQATGKDIHSLNEWVNFVSPTDLHINSNYFTRLDGGATPIAGITKDIDGNTRNATTPDIGADEFTLVNPSNWQIQNTNLPADVRVVSFSAVNNQVCWGVGHKFPANTTPYVGYIRTTDGGNNWICDTIPGIPSGYLQDVFAIDADTAYITVYVQSGQSGKGVYKTTDAGNTWTRQNAYNNSLYGPAYIYFFDSQNGVVVGDPNLETYTTSNGGSTWNPVTMPPALSGELTWLGASKITAIGNTAWFGTGGTRVFKSTDKGHSWNVVLTEPPNWVAHIAFQDTSIGIIALRQGGDNTNHIFRKTTDGGASWNVLTNSVLDNIQPSGICQIPGTASTYIVTAGRTTLMRGTAISFDAGESWTLIDTTGFAQICFPSDVFGWSSSYSPNIVYKYVGPRITTVEEEKIDIMPTGYSLSQNYPNPFNPSTTFRYSIPAESKVTIKVYDILGKEVATLVDEDKTTGTYELTWHAVNIPSGVYFYKLQAGEYTAVKKMILIK